MSIKQHKRKIKEVQYSEVRKLYGTGKYSYDDIARLYNKSREWVRLVVNGSIPKKLSNND